MEKIVEIYQNGPIALRLKGPYSLRQKFMINNLLSNAPDAIDCLPPLFDEAIARQGLYFVPRNQHSELETGSDALMICSYEFWSQPIDWSKPQDKPQQWSAEVKAKIASMQVWAIPLHTNENCLKTLLEGRTVVCPLRQGERREITKSGGRKRLIVF